MNFWVQKGCNLKKILKGVSRSIYLSLIFLPKKIRHTMGLGYLFCRAADTIADTDLIPAEERLKILSLYRKQFIEENDTQELSEISTKIVTGGGLPDEEKLVANLSACFSLLESLPPADQQLLKDLVLELTLGMVMDLKIFGQGHSAKRSLNPRELDQYTYYVAGVVGKFWTRVLVSHFNSLKKWDLGRMADLGIRFGKGLQWVNILRDQHRDQERGRNYLNPLESQAVYLKQARDLLESGWLYIQEIPFWSVRLRGVCLIPLLLGFKTLRLPEGQKVTRREVYTVALLSLFLFWSPSLLRKLVLKPGLQGE
ncbi:MAG: squalene/phytoene synthase family protein [Deltaproteobacteria bacterium]|nr:squalene/phytoene synthase family protein [Deltaproteobacteria bacterium]